MEKQFVKLATVSGLGPERIHSFKVLARHVGIVRGSGGELFATEIGCKHQNADLCTGKLSGDVVTCPRHGWRYDLRTGECLNHDSAKLRRYELRIRGDDILVSLRPFETQDTDEDEPFPDVKIR